jgi:glycosyltransferase involved in cell wall biosynthesis
MNQTVDLSIITPCFNKADHLINHLSSLGSQTYSPERFEVIVVDDGSNDHTLPVVREARKVFDYPIRYFYLDRPGYTPAPLAWNFGIRQAKADIIVQMGPDTIAAKDALELHYAYQTMGPDHLYVFGRCYQIGSPFAQYLMDTVKWQENFRELESVFISEYHHSRYWSVPYLASIHKKWFEQLRGYDESYDQVFPDDSDMIVRLWAAGVETFNAEDIFGAHQWHEQHDPQCPTDCPCPLHAKSKTSPGPDMKYNGTPEDLVRNPNSWGEFPGAKEL